MYGHAIYEVHKLVSSIGTTIDPRSPVVQYLCALFAELAYYHIPQWEIDDKKRAKLVPCEAHRMLAGRGSAIDLNGSFAQFELRGFAVAERRVVAVGVQVNRLLFIGFRGTQFLFDWKFNLRSKLARINPSFVFRQTAVTVVAGGLHSGFAEEATRISMRVLDAVRDQGMTDVDHVILSGHSLGGAVAAIAEFFLRLGSTTVCILGAPRYADLSAYVTFAYRAPAQIRRPGDVVPTVPPRIFGYADHPYEFTTAGTPYFDLEPYSSTFRGLLRWLAFLAGRFAPHDMETYRKELGKTAHAEAAELPLVPMEKLEIANIRAQVAP